MGGGGHFLAQRNLYGGTFAFLRDDLVEFGITCDLIDITDPTNLTLAASLNPGGSWREVFVSGDFLYGATFGGLRVIDISDPTSPISLDYYATPGIATTVVVEGQHAYVADGAAGVRGFNLTQSRARLREHGLIEPFEGRWLPAAFNSPLLGQIQTECQTESSRTGRHPIAFLTRSR